MVSVGFLMLFLMEELDRIACSKAAKGRVILAYLGNGSSSATIREGTSLDTSMGLMIAKTVNKILKVEGRWVRFKTEN
jgi:acetate kinase